MEPKVPGSNPVCWFCCCCFLNIYLPEQRLFRAKRIINAIYNLVARAVRGPRMDHLYISDGVRMTSCL